MGDGAEELRQKLTDAVADVLEGTEWAPPDSGIVTDVVVIAGWRTAEDGSGVSYVGASSTWATEGLLHTALRMHCGEADDEE